MLLDPHATRAVPVLLPEGAHKAAPRMAPSQPADVPVLLGSLAAFVQPPFDWQVGACVLCGLMAHQVGGSGDAWKLCRCSCCGCTKALALASSTYSLLPWQHRLVTQLHRCTAMTHLPFPCRRTSPWH